ncbi:MAG: hypothetical protein ACP5IE_04345 [Infirmifilum sp.]
MTLVTEFRDLMQGFGGNKLLAKRRFYDEIAYVNDGLVKFGIGDFGTGKTVAARWVVNNSLGTMQYAIHIPLRNITSLPDPPPNVRDKYIGAIIRFILNPKISDRVYANYEKLDNIDKANDEMEYFQRIAEMLKNKGRQLVILLDEVDMPTTTGAFMEVLSDPNAISKLIGDLSWYIRGASDHVRGNYINLVVLGASDAIRGIKDKLMSRFVDLNYLRFREVKIPRNMNREEYASFFRNICEYYGFKCNIDQLSRSFASLDVPLWVAVDKVKREVEKILVSSKCNNVECVRSQNYELNLSPVLNEVKIYKSLENATWTDSVRKFVNRSVHREVEEYLWREATQHLSKIGSITEKRIHPQIPVYYLDLPNDRRIIIMFRLKGGEFSLGDTVLEALKSELKKVMPESKSRKDMRPLIYLIKHKTVDARRIRNAVISIGAEYTEKIIPSDALYVAVVNVMGLDMGIDRKALEEFIEDIKNDIDRLLKR